MTMGTGIVMKCHVCKKDAMFERCFVCRNAVCRDCRFFDKMIFVKENDEQLSFNKSMTVCRLCPQDLKVKDQNELFKFLEKRMSTATKKVSIIGTYSGSDEKPVSYSTAEEKAKKNSTRRVYCDSELFPAKEYEEERKRGSAHVFPGMGFTGPQLSPDEEVCTNCSKITKRWLLERCRTCPGKVCGDCRHTAYKTGTAFCRKCLSSLPVWIRLHLNEWAYAVLKFGEQQVKQVSDRSWEFGLMMVEGGAVSSKEYRFHLFDTVADLRQYLLNSLQSPDWIVGTAASKRRILEVNKKLYLPTNTLPTDTGYCD